MARKVSTLFTFLHKRTANDDYRYPGGKSSGWNDSQWASCGTRTSMQPSGWKTHVCLAFSARHARKVFGD